jgi:chromosome segregation ATPase
MFSDLDGKPRFKEVSYKIRFATSSLAWNFNKRLTPIPLDRFIYPILLCFLRLWEQRDALDALVKALRTGDGWLAYRAEALRDQLLELEAQTAEGASAVEKVQTALVDRDEALQRAREDLAKVRTLAAEWETEVASVRAQLQRDRATLEEARAWQSQAEEKAKEAEELSTSVADKVASLASVEEQLR